MTMKKMNLKILVILIFLSLSQVMLSGCTDQGIYLSGALEVDLEPGMKLVHAEWRADTVWCLTRPMRDDEFPETYSFVQYSSLGVNGGPVTINEFAAE